MPELLEVERYRRHSTELLGQRIVDVVAPDGWYVKGGLAPRSVEEALRGALLTDARRIGKLLVLDTDRARLGIRFGMTGRLIVNGSATIERLEYGGHADRSEWDRFALRTDHGELRVRDPRRLGGVELEPDESLLGPDATSISRVQLASALRSACAVKARLMDQRRVAGLGNLLTDELLWRARVDPARPARSLEGDEIARVRRAMRATLRVLDARGGSHCGDLQAERRRDGRCPRDGHPLDRRTIGGRTTYSCGLCQH